MNSQAITDMSWHIFTGKLLFTTSIAERTADHFQGTYSSQMISYISTLNFDDSTIIWAWYKSTRANTDVFSGYTFVCRFKFIAGVTFVGPLHAFILLVFKHAQTLKFFSTVTAFQL